MSFNRGELQSLRDRALQMAQSVGSSNLLAMRAYAELASAADKLDAMLARDEPRPVAASSPPVTAPRTTQQLQAQIELESEGEDGEEEMYDPSR